MHYRRLNAAVVPENYSLSHMDECRDRLKEVRPRKRWMLYWEIGVPFFLQKFFETDIVCTLSHTASLTTADGDLKNACDSNDEILETNKLQALHDMAAPLFTLDLFKERKHDYFCQLIF